MNNETIDTRQWWVQRWLELLDSYRFKKRLERARIYAREGNVLSIEFKNAQVLAKVQGSEPQPYEVALSIDPFSQENWQDIISTMSEKAIFLAQLLAGEMPSNIEEVFTANGLSLFPFTLSEIHSRCSCPDPANPCKHIGAVYYQLGDRFSEDPFVIFQLRGRTKEEIINDLRSLRRKEKGLEEDILTAKKVEHIANQLPKEVDLNKFFQYNEALDSSLVVITPPVDNKSILDILGSLPLPYTDAQAVEQYLRQVYQAIPLEAMKTALNSLDSTK